MLAHQVLLTLGYAFVAAGNLIVPNRYIVEYTSARPNSGSQKVAPDSSIKVLKSFNSDVFSGASVYSERHNIDSLSSLAGIARVWPVKNISLPKLEMNAEDLFGDDGNASLYDIHGATGVDRLHNAGIYGEGVVIGIVDTGVWYPHPAAYQTVDVLLVGKDVVFDRKSKLGGGFGPGYKVSGGYDLVGDSLYPVIGFPPMPDKDPLDEQGHGTHVAGIAVGQSDKFTGVAPHATMRSYKVFGVFEETTEDMLIEGFLMAYADGVDIITCSVGGPGGYADDAWPLIASRIVDQGIVVTIAAGNDGASGPFFASNGASGKGVIAVASMLPNILAGDGFNVKITMNGNSSSSLLAYSESSIGPFPSTIIDMPIVALDYDTTNPAEACSPYPSTTRNLTGVIALVRRGNCTFVEKQSNLEALGAQYILFYNNDNPITSPVSSRTSQVGLVPVTTGQYIIDVLKAGGSISATFLEDPPVVNLENIAGGRPSFFTSWGGLYDLSINPTIAAPGGQIFSTWLQDGYMVLDGTSMATPYIAGVAALYISVYGGRAKHGPDFAKQLTQKIITSGATLPWLDPNGTLDNFGFTAPVPQVGNGLVNAFKVVNYSTVLDFDPFELNDTRYFQQYHDINIMNNAPVSVTYTFGVEPAAAVSILETFNETVYPSPRLNQFLELTPIDVSPSVEFPAPMTLSCGETKKARFTFSKPYSYSPPTNMPLYSGKVTIVSSIGEELSIPYMGLDADLRASISPSFETDSPIATVGTLTNITQDQIYTFNVSYEVQSFPYLLAIQKWGTKELRWDIFGSTYTERSWTYPPVVGNAGYVGSATQFIDGYFGPGANFSDVMAFPMTGIPRNDQYIYNPYTPYLWLGTLADGTQIPNGKYTFRFAALDPFGNPTKRSDWSLWLIDGELPVFEIARPGNATGVTGFSG